jgi:hypothetical protein
VAVSILISECVEDFGGKKETARVPREFDEWPGDYIPDGGQTDH